MIMSSVRVDRFAAFGANTVGPRGTPFPLSVSVAAREGLWVVRATAARAYDLLDVLKTGDECSAAVLNVGQSSWLNGDCTPWSLREIARQQDVAVIAHDIRWAAVSRAQSDDLLVMVWSDLRRFLDGWSLYEITVLDLLGTQADEDLDELAPTLNHRPRAGGRSRGHPAAASQHLGRHDRRCPARPRRRPGNHPDPAGVEVGGPDTDTTTIRDHAGPGCGALGIASRRQPTPGVEPGAAGV
jgi:hypothetical protein